MSYRRHSLLLLRMWVYDQIIALQYLLIVFPLMEANQAICAYDQMEGVARVLGLK